MDVGAALARARKLRGLTQDDLSKLLNCTTQTVSNYERGIRKPDIDTLQKIAKLLKMPISAFLEDDFDGGNREIGDESAELPNNMESEQYRERGNRKMFIAISGIANGKGVPEYIRIKFNDASIQMSYQGISGSFDNLYCQMSKTAKLSVIKAMLSRMELTEMDRLNLFSGIDSDYTTAELEEKYDDEGEI